MVSIAWAFCDGTGTSCVAIAALQRLPSCVRRAKLLHITTAQRRFRNDVADADFCNCWIFGRPRSRGRRGRH